MFDGAGWTCLVAHPGGDVLLTQRDDSGRSWTGEHRSRSATGTVAGVLTACVGPGSEEWVQAVAAAIAREIEVGLRRSALVVLRGEGEMFHVSRRVNRASILEHGLHPDHMTNPGVAGSTSPEWPGTFLCDWDSVDFFVEMARGDVDV